MISFDEEAGQIIVEREGVRETYPLDDPEAFAIASDLWLRAGWGVKHAYTFTWLGRPVIQMPEDLLRLQELVTRVQPDVIVETGVAHGGSLVFHAGLCKLLGRGKVIGVDIEIRPHNRAAIEAHALAHMIELVEGDSVDPAVVSEVASRIAPDDTRAPDPRLATTRASTFSRSSRRTRRWSPRALTRSRWTATSWSSPPAWREARADWRTNNPKAAAAEFVTSHPGFVLDEPDFAFDESLGSRAGDLLRRWGRAARAMTTSLTVVIPTRNRAELAMARHRRRCSPKRARRCACSCPTTPPVRSRRGRLADFCRGAARPAAHLPARGRHAHSRRTGTGRSSRPSHARTRAISRFTTTGSSRNRVTWRYLLDEIEAHPGQVITYPIDQVLRGAAALRRLADRRGPGRPDEMRAARVLQMASEGRIAEMGHAFPILSNCAVPRAADRQDPQAASATSATRPGPDAAFTFRFCALADSYLHLDRPLASGLREPPQRRERLSHRGEDGFRGLQAVSRGSSVARRGAAPGAQPELEHALPRVRARAQGGSDDRLPELTLAAYLDGLAWGLPLVEDPARRQAMEEVLVANGWQRDADEPASDGARRVEGCARVWGACVRRHRPLVRLAAAAGAIPEPNGFTFPTEVAGGRVRKDHARGARHPEEPAARSPARGLSAAHAVWVATWL